MSGFALLDVQESIYQALAQDSTLASAGWRAVNFAKDTLDGDYIIVGNDDDQSDESAKLDIGSEVAVTLRFWSKSRGSLKIKTAMGRVYDMLHMQSIAVTNQSHVLTHCDFAKVIREPDGITVQGIMRLRVLVYSGDTGALASEASDFLEPDA